MHDAKPGNHQQTQRLGQHGRKQEERSQQFRPHDGHAQWPEQLRVFPYDVSQRARVTVEASVVGNPQIVTVTSSYFGQSFSVMKLRRGELYDITISGEGYLPYVGRHRVVGGDGEPIRVVLVR